MLVVDMQSVIFLAHVRKRPDTTFICAQLHVMSKSLSKESYGFFTV